MSLVRLRTLVVAVCVLHGALLGAPAAFGAVEPPATPSQSGRLADAARPNIVVFYLDDLNPHDGRLWSDPAITPNLHDLFVANGIHFQNAIGETPLCCPGRGSFLTGLHTHNHGVTVNDVRLFNPGEHLGKALSEAGYDTSMIGKYFNWAERLTAAQWQPHAAGWTNLDVYMRDSGLTEDSIYLDYTIFTKEGAVAYPDTHFTRMIADRAVSRMRESSPETPIFELLSIYNPHAPNIPMPEFAADPRCDSMPPWNPPNYNEADVSDKPGFVQSFPLQPYPDGWPMVDLCRAMIGVDWLVGQVVDELRAEGRLDNTLFVFSADNGMGWGEHRWDKKRMPYTTPVPLYMNWPARWGEEHRVIADGTSNIDIAPTLCDFAGCTLGPYPGGQAAPDGISLAPLLDGSVSSLGREALLETNYGSRSWSAVRTTTASPLGLWHYIVQPTGFEELYDLSVDPWELDNLAKDPTTSDLRSELSNQLAILLQEGRVVPPPQRPDGSIAIAAAGIYKGENIYGTVPKTSQTQTLKQVLKHSVHDFSVRVTNHGSSPATYSVLGASGGSGKIWTSYLVDETDVTAAVVAGTYSFADVQPGTSVDLVIRMMVGKAPLKSKRSAVITLALAGEGASDVLKAVVIRSNPPPPPPPPPASAGTRMSPTH